MSWQVQGHFCRIMRHHDNLEKQYKDKTKRYRIERLHNNFKVYRNILEYVNGIVTYAKGI
jgi:hypothetical protein